MESNTHCGRAILGSKGGSKQTTVSNLSVAAPVFIPKQKQQTEPHKPGISGDGFNSSPVQKLHDLICTLTSDPAFYAESLEKIAEGFGNNVKDEQTLIDVVGELVHQCIEEPNFRYTGARICQAFSTDLKVGFPDGNFRQYLLKRVHEEHKKRNSFALNDKKHLVGFMMFIGELLIHMRVGEVKKRIEILATAVLELITICLDNADEMVLKSTVQVLKLAGCILHHMEKQSNSEQKTPKIDLLFSKLKDIVAEAIYSRNLRQSILKLIEDRINWDNQQVEDTVVETQLQHDSQKPFTNEPTFYNAAGQVITAAEAGFAVGQYDDGYHGFEQDYENEYAEFDPNEYETGEITEEELAQFLENTEGDSSNEWDDEIASAYEEFLQNQQNDAHNRLANGR